MVKRLPEAKRASEKKKILDGIAVRRKEITKKMNEWEKKAGDAERKVKL
jgi:hypothetical protein